MAIRPWFRDGGMGYWYKFNELVKSLWLFTSWFINSKFGSIWPWQWHSSRGNISRLWHMRCAIACARLCTRLKCYRHAKKSTPCLIKKASRCAADRTSKTTFFIFHFLCNTKIVRENHVYLFVIWLVQWWKLYYIYIFFTQRTTDLYRLKRNMDDGTIVFLTSLLIALTWNILLLFYFWQKKISCFK